MGHERPPQHIIGDAQPPQSKIKKHHKFKRSVDSKTGLPIGLEKFLDRTRKLSAITLAIGSFAGVGLVGASMASGPESQKVVSSGPIPHDYEPVKLPAKILENAHAPTAEQMPKPETLPSTPTTVAPETAAPPTTVPPQTTAPPTPSITAPLPEVAPSTTTPPVTTNTAPPVTQPSPQPITQANVVWPFATKSQSQEERIDQGWDLQGGPGDAVHAIADGWLNVDNPDPKGFGIDFPVETLKSSIGGPSNYVYYGHTHILPSLRGKNVPVKQGQEIATTNVTDVYIDAKHYIPKGWLEIGFAWAGIDGEGTDEPIAQKDGDEPNGDYGEHPTQDGQTMYFILKDAVPAPQ